MQDHHLFEHAEIDERLHLDLLVGVDVLLAHVGDDPYGDVRRVDAAEAGGDDDQLGVHADVPVHVVHDQPARHRPSTMPSARDPGSWRPRSIRSR